MLSIIKNGKLNDKKSFSGWKQNRLRDAEKLGYIKKNAETKKEINKKYMVLGLLSFIAALFLWGAFLGSDLIESMESVVDAVKIFTALLMVDVLLLRHLGRFVPIHKSEVVPESRE